MATAIRKTVTGNCSSSGWCQSANITKFLSEKSDKLKPLSPSEVLQYKAQNPTYEILRIIPSSNNALQLIKVNICLI